VGDNSAVVSINKGDGDGGRSLGRLKKESPAWASSNPCWAPETLRNLERKSCKTVFLGSQDFKLRTVAAVLLTASIRLAGRRYPQYSQVLSDRCASPVSSEKPRCAMLNASC
jgi:hypothetical protein